MKSAIKILQSHLQTILSIMSSLNHLLPLFFFFFTLSILNSSISQPQSATNISVFSSSNSPWRPAQNQTLLSPNATFAAGFLPVPNSPGLYTFSVWFRNVSQNAVVWSATNPPVSAAASLIISRSGELRLVDSPGNATNLWPSRPVASVNGSGLSLLPTGNLVYGNFESFDFPTNTILPNQQINGTTLVSSNGKYRFDSRQLVFIGRNDNYWTNHGNLTFMSLDDLGVIVYGDDGKYYASDFGVKKLRKLSLDNDGNLRMYSYDVRLSQWIVRWQALFQLCMVHGTCGANSICMYDASNFSTSCVCPPGYTKGPGDSCQLKIPLSSSGRTKFLRLDFVNFTGGLDQNDIETTNFTTCEASCLSRPNCLGFMFKYDGSNFCVLQLGRMVNGYWSPGTEKAMFLRVDESESDVSSFTGMTSLMQTMCPVRIRLPEPPQESRTITRNIVLVCALFVAELLFGAFFFRTFLNKYIKYRDMARTFGLEVMPAGGPKRFSYAELKVATNNFSNPIGKGGFGIVYMGKLSDGRVVAVKSLKNITGGDADFWAEVTIIARMHHLNLVRLWGFCAEKGSRILVYEYVPNGSLDEFLFQTVEEDGPLESEGDALTLGSKGKPILDWNIRYRIALGVARAIAYLHEECLEWVLHCDIKPENILLGDDFCPKVSDFGLAKLKKKEDMISMSRIRGTPGYMAPEWARPDQITSKADVYSYGLVLLEIVSGSRNFAQLDSKVESDQWFLPGWAYDKVFKEMSVEDVLDQRIKQSYDSRAHFDMVNRMVKTAMWCLQERPEARPSMGKVAKMLEGTVEITPPNKPNIFYLDG
ncbi:G-type lectin S-receptor-like serine/threonine-protein kinase At1g34300 [Salvia splendens]|uniref:G-type lectin S-receptor-like serine/threonine-protein kinase At1g34300 n=1 Tax=Salvia splendens TaxID=180675 RepID=UPI001C2560F9|nr:G-type lectin S-receptor-like serine/threonine-protein kinase At1g34300 [Salvia splendens]